MAAEDLQSTGHFEQRTLLIFGLGVCSAVTGAVLAIRGMYFVPSEQPMVAIIAVLTVVTPLVFGYCGESFAAGVLAGSLPYTGMWAGAGSASRSAEYVETLVGGALYGLAPVLPVAGLLYIFGVALRRDGTVHDRNAELALRMVTVTVLAVLLFTIAESALLTPYGDQ